MTSRRTARTLTVLSSIGMAVDKVRSLTQPSPKRFKSTIRLCAYALLLLAPLAWTQDYTVFKFPTLGGSATRAFAINDQGQVVGVSSVSNGNSHAFLWTNTAGIEDLGTLGGPTSSASGINQSGQVVGRADNQFSGYAFLWTHAGGMHDLGSLGAYSSASGVNSSSEVAGSSQVGSGDYVHAFLWTETGGMQDLGTLAGGALGSVAYAINDGGQIVGSSYIADNSLHAFVWTQAGGMQDLGTLGGPNSGAYGINNSGDIVGYSDTTGGVAHAFLWTQAAGMQDLGVLPGLTYSSALGITTAGEVVGSSWSQTAKGSPFLWTQSGGMKALGPFGDIPLTNGDAINDAGLILASLYNGNGYTSYLLTPSGTTATFTTISSRLNPSIYGQSITFKATVTTSGSLTPTGTVNFTWSGHSIGTATLNSSGVGTLTKSNLNVYTYPLTAAYSGDANNLASTSTILNQVVKQATSTATLTSSPNPSTLGQAVTFTAKITSPTAVPTGPVTFKVGATVLGTAQLTAGKAVFTTSTLAVGSTTVTATYPWNSNIAGSSATVTQVVDQ